MILTFDQIHKYFEKRLDRSLPTRDKIAVKCPFHDDRSASATVFLNGNGGFNCQACQAKGNIFQIEMRFSNCTMAEAKTNVAQMTGARMDVGGNIGPVTAVYDYRTANDLIAFQKRRHVAPDGKKTFRIYRPDGRGGWIAGFDPEGKKVLYNLPQVITANLVVICEGEKDCDTVDGLSLFTSMPEIRIATTTNFEGAWQPGHAPKWQESYNPYFAGKFVVIMEDNDESGRAWAEYVCKQVSPYTDAIRRVSFPDLPEKGDVSDWMQSHTAAELENRIKSTPRWELPKKEFVSMSQDAVEFMAENQAPVEWLVDNVIPTAGNGIICGDPKAAKSFSALDLAISISCGIDWLGHRVARRARTYLVSREDAPGITQRRIHKLIQGNYEYAKALDGWMRINTRRHTTDFKVTNPEHMDLLISEIKQFGCELCILDVFRSVHDSEENDNDEMPGVLAKVNRIQNECQCAVMLVHHLNKSTPENIFKGLRGASAIHGWMEWGIGISVVNPEEEDKNKWVRKLEFENKEGVCLPVFMQVVSDSPEHVRIVKVDSQYHTPPPREPRPIRTKMKERRYGGDND